MVTKFKQHAQNLNIQIVVSITTDAKQNYNHWSYFLR